MHHCKTTDLDLFGEERLQDRKEHVEESSSLADVDLPKPEGKSLLKFQSIMFLNQMKKALIVKSTYLDEVGYYSNVIERQAPEMTVAEAVAVDHDSHTSDL